MSVAAAARAAATLWPVLLKHLKRLGRWLVERLKTKGVQKLLAFMELRIETFKGRLSRARRDRRKRWLSGRIKRWEAARKWLERHAERLLDRVAAALADRAQEAKVEWDAAGESYARWSAAA